LLPVLALVLSVVFWFIDSIIDVLVFEESESILENFLSPEPVELWMRVLVVLLLFGFSFYARYLLAKQINASMELEKYKNELEEMVGLRTKEIEFKNAELEAEIKLRKKMEKTLEKIASLKSEGHQ